jgi:hypothetical protein
MPNDQGANDKGNPNVKCAGPKVSPHNRDVRFSFVDFVGDEVTSAIQRL